MCGRFTLRTPAGQLISHFGLKELAEFAARFNIAPTQSVLAIRANQSASTGEPWEAAWLYWGLVPSWAKDKSIGASLINARSESLAEKPSFRAAFKKRRCLVVGDGFYEWQAHGKKKQPYYIHPKQGGPLVFAGLWEVWKGESPPLESCTIVTTEAQGAMCELHHRTPVILGEGDYSDWLSSETPSERLAEIMAPQEHLNLEFKKVSTYVNSARHEGPECLTPGEKTLF